MLSKQLKQGDKVLELLRREFPEYHPMIGIAQIAHSTDDERLRFDCHKTLAEYVEPKLKSVEVSQAPPDSGQLRVVFEGEYEEVSDVEECPAIEDKSEEPLPVEEYLMLDLSRAS